MPQAIIRQRVWQYFQYPSLSLYQAQPVRAAQSDQLERLGLRVQLGQLGQQVQQGQQVQLQQ
jgi:hypothetical protein